MSCTFWMLRKKRAALAKKQAEKEVVAPAKEAVTASKPSVKKGGAKNGK